MKALCPERAKQLRTEGYTFTPAGLYQTDAKNCYHVQFKIGKRPYLVRKDNLPCNNLK